MGQVNTKTSFQKMKSKLILSILILGSFLGQAQTFDFVIDHQAFVVKNLEKEADFYANILQLREITSTETKATRRWFDINGSALHLIKNENITVQKDKNQHLCLSTQDLEEFIKVLEKNNIAYEDWAGTKNSITNRKDGVRQIYLQDPEGYWLEINTAQHN